MRRVVFASGSPFPIFAPHGVAPDQGTNVEWLVDGGYAHNIPLEAAKAIGTRQVLLLNSSPMEDSGLAETQASDPFGIRGQLIWNLDRLFPFLFERSQVADLLIREQMFLVSLAPVPPKNEWPALFDFRRSTVEMLIAAAQKDTTNRIGRIETAGPPLFLISVRMGRDNEPGATVDAEGIPAFRTVVVNESIELPP